MSQGRPSRLGILVSGNGSNLQAFIDAQASGELSGDIALVISNQPEAYGLQRAIQAGIATHTINHRDYPSREAFDQALVDALEEAEIDLVILAGFMRILTPVFIQPYQGRLLNIHPSLLPKYPGLNTHQRALDAGDTEAGTTVHFVTQELDGGPPIVQAALPIDAGDDASSLAQRVHHLEWKIYPMAAQWWLENRLVLKDGGAWLDGQPLGPRGVCQRIDEPA